MSEKARGIRLYSRTCKTSHTVTVEDVQELADNFGGWLEKHTPISYIEADDCLSNIGVAMDKDANEIFKFSVDDAGTLKIVG